VAELGLAGAARAVAARELSPAEVTEASLERIDALEPSLRAFVTVDRDGALDAARRLGEEPADGPLHGIPIGVKDLIDVAGLPTTASSRILADNEVGADAPVVASLRRAGAVIVGKTTTHEFAYGTVCAPTLNPWDLGRIPGGSSGGSAVAVAAGMSLAALGTDTAGSIRIPAALCGVTGLKPRPGLVSLEGVIPLAPSLDVCGPLARDAADVALAWEALTGARPPTPPARPPRIAAPASWSQVGELHSGVEGALERACGDLAAAEASFVVADLPRFEEWDWARAVVLMSQALEVHREAGWYPARADEYTEETLSALRFAEGFEPSALAEARRATSALGARLRSALDGVDVLLLPTTPIPAPTLQEARARDAGHRTPVARTLTRICGPVNVCGLAAVSLPCGFTSEGLPVGMQFVAHSEEAALQAALFYQSVTDWHRRRPRPEDALRLAGSRPPSRPPEP
jgi:aspartyl-tRNA(Asn)/glutamyl-tRNA(Gln) amidotransferase subunit A